MAGNGRIKTTTDKHISTIQSIITDNNLPLIFKGLIDIDSVKHTGMAKIHFFCTECNDDIKSISIDNFKKNRKCSGCSNRNRKNRCMKSFSHYHKLIEDEILNKNLPYLCNGTNHYDGKKKTKVDFDCNKHKLSFSASIDNFLAGKGCPECGKERMITSKLKSHNEHISGFEEIHSDKYLYDKFVWNGVHEPSTFICKVHNYEFQRTPANFRRKVEHCPLCSGEIDINTIPTDVYVQRITKNGLVFCKFGISTDTHRRMVQQKWLSGAEHELLWNHTFENRIDAMRLEKLLKESVDRGVVDISVLPDGFTETFDEKYLSLVLEIVNNFK